MSVTTDAGGRAQIAVRAGSVAGPASIDVRAVEQSVIASAMFTVLPGIAVRIQPGATALAVVEVGGTSKLDFQIYDRANNLTTTADVTVDTTIAIVDSDGTVHARSKVGKANLTVRSGPVLSQNFSVSVVPVARIVVSRRTSTTIELVSMGLDGNHVQSLIGPEPTIAFNQFRDHYDMYAAANGVIYFVNVDDTGSHLWVRDASGQRRRLTNSASGTTHEAFPLPSIDGGWMYFIAQTATTNPTLWRIRPDGTAEEQIGPVFEASSRSPFFGYPSADPDGAAVYLSRLDPPSGVQTWRYNVATGALSLARFTSSIALAFSPKRDKAAYVRSGAYTLRDVATGHEFVIPQQSGTYTFSASPFSPDGKWILLAHLGAIFISDTETGALIPVGGKGYNYDAGQWIQ